MTTETKAPTAEDVERWAKTLGKFLQEGWDPKSERFAAAINLVDLALLGVQVPGLTAERDALRAQVDRMVKASRPLATWAASKLNLRPGPDNAMALGFGFSVINYGHLREFVASCDAVFAPPAEAKTHYVPAPDACTSECLGHGVPGHVHHVVTSTS